MLIEMSVLYDVRPFLEAKLKLKECLDIEESAFVKVE